MPDDVSSSTAFNGLGKGTASIEVEVSDGNGKVIRIPLPEMSRERRLEFVKTCHKLAEDGRVHVRNLRRDCLEALKKAKLPEDESKRLEKDVQGLTDKFIKEIGDHLAHKEQELLKV